MKNAGVTLIPLIIGLTIGGVLFLTVGWWGFTILFPWIGLAISIGIHLRLTLARKKKRLGRQD